MLQPVEIEPQRSCSAELLEVLRFEGARGAKGADGAKGAKVL